jgi:hypothetical protein
LEFRGELPLVVQSPLSFIIDAPSIIDRAMVASLLFSLSIDIDDKYTLKCRSIDKLNAAGNDDGLKR